MSKTIVIGEHLDRHFGDGPGRREVLRDLTLRVDEGEMVAIIGASGSGKSTLLSILGGLDRGYTGTLSLFGKAIEPLDDRALSALRAHSLGFVFQSFQLLSHLSSLENVALPSLFGPHLDDAEAKASAELANVGLGDRLHDRPAQLSGGQRQRVAIARAMLYRPPLLLCDEPTGNLDRETGAQIIQLFRELHARGGVTLVVVTHDERIAKAATRVLHLEHGELREKEGAA